MALAKEILGASLLEKSACLSSFHPVLNDQKQGQFCLSPRRRSSFHVRKSGRRASIITPVAAISERNLIKFAPETTAVEFNVRAVVTVRNKHKEDLKETIVKQLDAWTDKMGRNVVLELVSTEIDPSKHCFIIFS